MVQELVPGGDDSLFTLGSYVDRRGTPLAVFSGRKLRQTPPGIGTCRLGEALWVEEVVDRGFALLRAFSYTGISQVEFKRDPRSGRLKLMEINARLWQWHGLAAACGADPVQAAYLDLTGRRVDPVTSNGRRTRWAIALVPHERPLFVRPPDVEAVFALDDPRPAVTHLARFARNSLR
jgi:predicted ATP-grasp superfamily ATP-dependent carboligase